MMKILMQKAGLQAFENACKKRRVHDTHHETVIALKKAAGKLQSRNKKNLAGFRGLSEKCFLLR